jgi:monoamine oxidase
VDADVLVLGAGMAGLSAARDLVRAGLRVLVVEARGRVGGRVHTLHDAETPVPIELGAEMLHGEADATIEAAHALRLAIVELDGDRYVRTNRGLAAMKRYDDRIAEGLRAAFAAARGRDVDFASAMARAKTSASIRALTRSFVESFHAGDARAIGSRGLELGGAEGPGRSMRIAAGYSSLAAAMASQLAGVLRLGCTIESIEPRKGHVRVSYRGVTGRRVKLAARAAVVALPLGVLRAAPGSSGAVAFDPPIDGAHARALERLEMGHVWKMTFRFREAFWLDHGREKAAFFHDAKSAVPTFWTARPADAPVLVAWAGGPAARALDAPAGAGDRLARSMGDAMFFAGEHTCAPPGNATVDGAIASGKRAANDVIALLG